MSSSINCQNKLCSDHNHIEEVEKVSLIKRILISPFVLLIKLYQWIISPILGPKCRFTPTCSTYALQAFKKYGPLKGFWLAFKRIIRCHPWGGHGYDPLP